MAPRLASQAMGLPSKSTTTWEAYAAGSGDTSRAQQLGTSPVTLSRRGYTLDREGNLTRRGRCVVASGAVSEAAEEPRARELTREEGRRLLDERARRFLGVSGDEFRRRYKAGELDPDDDHVLGVALLLPLAD
jgi:hypothetical protein